MEKIDHLGYCRALQTTVKRYRRRQAAHVTILLLYLAVVVGRPVWALAKSGLLREEQGIPLLLVTAAFFTVPVLLYGWYIRLYQKAIRRAAAGELLILSGEITASKGNRITVRETLPPEMKRSAWQHLTREHPFRLPTSSREQDLRVGDRITLWYPADRILWAGIPAAVWVQSREEEKNSAAL